GTPDGIGGDEQIEPGQRAFEFMLNALRLVEGFSLSSFEQRTGLERARIAPQLALAFERGGLERTDEHVRPTPTGRRFTNDVISLFLTDLSDGSPKVPA